jgi:ribonuclease T1
MFVLRFLLIAVLLFAVACDGRTPPARGGMTGVVMLSELPAEARETLARIRNGGPFPYRKDGSVFGNREGRLPPRARGYYREYTVPTPGSRDRGARRIVAGRGSGGNVATSGEYYYTDDHYETFRRIRE